MKLNTKVFFKVEWYTLAFIISAGIIITLAAYFYFSYEVKTIRNKTFNELKSIATLKASQISNWNKERMADANTFVQNPFFVGSLEKLSGSVLGASLKSGLIKTFKLINTDSDYSNIILTNPEGKLLLSLDSKVNKLDSVTAHFIKVAANKKKTTFTDLYRTSSQSKIYLDYIAPIIDKRDVVIAVLILRVNPATFLYPLIKKWPVPSQTSETLIVRKENGSVLFLNELKNLPDAALKFMIPLSRKEVPAVQAALGRKGIFEGINYRGTHVLSYISPVNGTPWIMVAIEDTNEIDAELYFKEFVIIAFTVISIFVLGGSLIWYYSNRQKNTYKKLFIQEKQLREQFEEFKTTLYSIGDGVIITDKNGKIKNMNHASEELTGWNESEVKGREVKDIFNIINEVTRARIEDPIYKVLSMGILTGLANHTLLISRNGKEIPIVDSAAPIKSETGEILGVVLVFRDQSIERITQKAIEESRRRFLSLFTNLNEGVALYELVMNRDNQPVNYRIIDVNPQFEKMLGVNRLEISGKLATEVYNTNVAPYLETYCNVALTNKPYNFEVYYESMDKYFNISAVPWLNNGFASIITDITGRKLAEQALTESEERFRAVYDASPSAIVISNIESGKLIEINNACEKLFGYTRDEVLGISTFELGIWINNLDRKTMTDAIKSKGFYNNLEINFKTKNNSIINCLISGRIIFIKNEKLMLTILHDITDIQNAAQAIKESEERFRKIFEEHSAVQLLIDGGTGTIIDANKAALEYYGWAKDELLGMNINEINTLSPGIVKEKIDSVKQLKKDRFEFCHRLKDGSIRDVEVFSSRVDIGGIEYLYSIIHDITDRKVVEESLIKEKELLQALLDNIPDTIYFKDKNSKFTRINKAQAKVLGISKPEDAAGKSDFDFFENKHAEEAYEDEQKIIKSKIPLIAKLEKLRIAGGKYRWFTATKVPIIDSKGNCTGLVGLSRDITSVKLNEEKLEKYSQRLKELNAGKNKLFSIIAHDLRSPFNPLLGISEVLVNDFDALSREELIDYCQTIYHSLNNIYTLLDNLLNWSRLQIGQMKFMPENINLYEKTENAIILLSGNAKLKDITLLNETVKDIYVTADPIMLQSILQNLIGNSIKFTNKGGLIKIFSEIVSKDVIQVTVSDNGLGMTKEQIQSLFDLTAASTLGTNGEKGTGLGLLICKEIIEQNGGTISVKSEPGKGTDISFTMPKAK
jgi:PAS domain S-box-containing protein